MFTKAVEWRWVATNPVKIARKSSPGIKLNPENVRERTLEDEELPELLKALAEHKEDRQGVHIIQLLLMTGARVGETQAAKWVDIKDGIWSKPASSTKSGKLHRVPLSGPEHEGVPRLNLLSREMTEERASLDWRRAYTKNVFDATGPARVALCDLIGEIESAMKLFRELASRASAANAGTPWIVREAPTLLDHLTHIREHLDMDRKMG
jgi:integrase